MSGAVSKRGRTLLAKLALEAKPVLVEGPELKTARALERAHLVMMERTADDRNAVILIGPGRHWLRHNHPELLVDWYRPPAGGVQWLRAVIRHQIANEIERRQRGASGTPPFRGELRSWIMSGVLSAADVVSTSAHQADAEGEALYSQIKAMEAEER